MTDRDRKITQIVEDLAAIDPVFAADKKELKPVIAKLLSSKPQVELNPAFRANLRARLVSAPQIVKKPLLSPYTSFVSSFSNKLATGAFGALIALIVAVPLTYLAAKNSFNLSLYSSNSVKDASSGASLKQQINNKGTNAFGKIALLPPADTLATTSSGQSTSSSPSFASLRTSSSAHVSGSTAPVSYKYVGGPITLESDEGTVFKRDIGLDAGRQVSDFIQNWKFDLTDFSKFSKVSVQNLNLVQQGGDGYQINIDFNGGTISIINPVQPAATALSSSSVLSTAALTAITNNFLQVHSIDVSSYAKPVVEFDKISHGATSSIATVVYPLILDGKEVYDNQGSYYGLTVTVDMVSKKILSVENLDSQTYESSRYNLETDSVHILSKIPQSAPSQTTTGTVALGTPKQVLMRYLVPQADGSSNELYVPALLFTSTSSPQAAPVIVSLIKDELGRATSTSDSNSNTAATLNAVDSTSTSSTTPADDTATSSTSSAPTV